MLHRNRGGFTTTDKKIVPNLSSSQTACPHHWRLIYSILRRTLNKLPDYYSVWVSASARYVKEMHEHEYCLERLAKGFFLICLLAGFRGLRENSNIWEHSSQSSQLFPQQKYLSFEGLVPAKNCGLLWKTSAISPNMSSLFHNGLYFLERKHRKRFL